MIPAAPTKPLPKSNLAVGRDCLACIRIGRGLDSHELLGTEGPKEDVIRAIMYFSTLVPGASGWVVYDAAGDEVASGPVPKVSPYEEASEAA